MNRELSAITVLVAFCAHISGTVASEWANFRVIHTPKKALRLEEGQTDSIRRGCKVPPSLRPAGCEGGLPVLESGGIPVDKMWFLCAVTLEGPSGSSRFLERL